MCFFFFFQAEDGIRDIGVTGVQTCALPIWLLAGHLELLSRKAVETVGIDRRDIPPEALRHLLALGLAERGPGRADRQRSEERRVGKECRSRGAPDHEKKKKRKRERYDRRER